MEAGFLMFNAHTAVVLDTSGAYCIWGIIEGKSRKKI
jgi:hypothetical protein